MSKEEAFEPFPFQISEDETRSQVFRSLIFQALGAASACWDNLEGAGEFKSQECVVIGETLIHELRERGYLN